MRKEPTRANNFNYQRIYEEELSDNLKTSLELPDRFYELSHQQRMMVEELVDHGARIATEEMLDPEVLKETAALAAEMGSQLYHFANMIQTGIPDGEQVWTNEDKP
jgi:hypothetical protein